MAAAPSRPKLLVIVGETASGKSGLAFKIAKEFKGEIISADSWSVYRGFDIGTSKPSKGEQKAVKHHLIDVREASEGFNAPLFKELAETAINQVQKQSKLPILVGGTGLYIDSVIYDFGFLPNTGPDERAELDNMELGELLALAASRGIDLTDIDTRNKRRIIRAIETGGRKPTRQKLRPGNLVIGLRIGNEQLRKRIEKRTQQMFQAGLEQEVKDLSDRYGWNLEPMKGIGYREWQLYFEGHQTLEQTKDRIISATMNLAKRQRTWFKRDKNIQWFSSAGQAYDFVAGLLSN